MNEILDRHVLQRRSTLMKFLPYEQSERRIIPILHEINTENITIEVMSFQLLVYIIYGFIVLCIFLAQHFSSTCKKFALKSPYGKIVDQIVKAGNASFSGVTPNICARLSARNVS